MARRGEVKPDLDLDSTNRKIGERVRTLRIAHDLTNPEVAAAMRDAGHDWTFDTVSDVITGRRRRLQLTEIQDLAAVFGLSADGFLDGVFDPPTASPPAGRDLTTEQFCRGYDPARTPTGRLADMVRYAAASLARTPAERLAKVEDDIREAADLLIPAAMLVEGDRGPELSWADLEAARDPKQSRDDHFQAFYGSAGQRGAVDALAKRTGAPRVEVLRQLLAVAVPAYWRWLDEQTDAEEVNDVEA